MIAPLLFILVMDQVVKKVARRTGAINDAILMYADDVVIVEDNEIEFRRTITTWNEILTRNELKSN